MLPLITKVITEEEEEEEDEEKEEKEEEEVEMILRASGYLILVFSRPCKLIATHAYLSLCTLRVYL